MSIQLSSKYSVNQPYHVYYTLDLLNNDQDAPKAPLVFNYSENRNNPFLNSPENYFMSIVRFNLQTPTLPEFLPTIATGSANTHGVNQTAYAVTLTHVYSGTTYSTTVPIMYVSSNLTLLAPTSYPNLTINDITSDYYFMSSLGEFAPMINTALSLAYLGGTLSDGSPITGVRQQVVSAGLASGSISSNPPFVEYDPVNRVFILNADQATALVRGFQTDPTGANVSGWSVSTKIYFNSPLATLFSNFPQIIGSPSLSLGNQIIVFSANDTLLYNVPNPAYSAVQVYQNGGTTAGLFNPITSIVFQTTVLPVVMENIGTPKLTVGFIGGNNANINPIITDFEVPLTALNSYKPDISYTPTAEYRLVDLYGTSPVSNLNMLVYWKDKYSILHPFYLGNGCSASIKLMFRRKDYNNSKIF
jgi:hypothetical protein